MYLEVKHMESTEITIVKSEDESNKDLLNRQDFIDKMLNITEIISTSRKNVCYALNGKWGIGKSFVLDMFEKQIERIQSEETNTDKYFLFHYNCWQYDYYEEPIISIVSSMLDQIDEKENLLSDETKIKIKSALKAIGSGLIAKANQLIEDKTGIDMQEVINAIKTSNEEMLKDIAERNEFDSYFAFKKTLKALRETIESLAKEKTLIFVVDELDRCLPEYAIKVLERLHHVFDDIPNVQTIISVDKIQFEHTIKNIYGEKTDVEKYLAKFIDFEMNLDEGKLNDEFDNKFAYYLNKFDYINNATNILDVAEFKNHIFNGIDMRGKIEIIEKCDLLHKLLNSDEKKLDISFMCIEITLAVLKYWKVDLFKTKTYFNIKNAFDIKELEQLEFTGVGFLNSIYANAKEGHQYFGNKTAVFNETINWVRRDNIWGAILSCYRYIVGYTRDHFSEDNYKSCGLRDYSFNFRNLLYTIS